MSSWSDLQDRLNSIEPDKRGEFIAEVSRDSTARIAEHYDRNILYYASSLLQKPQVPGLFTSINMEDINGFMAGVHGHDFNKGLLLILHTPGGMAEAAQTIVDYLRQEARKSITYGKSLVRDWLQRYMFANRPDPAALASVVAEHFGGDTHGSHGRRTDREEARGQQLQVVDLEDDQTLQEEVLTLYHLSTIAFEMGPAAKSVMSSNKRLWVKNVTMEVVVQQPAQG